MSPSSPTHSFWKFHYYSLSNEFQRMSNMVYFLVQSIVLYFNEWKSERKKLLPISLNKMEMDMYALYAKLERNAWLNMLLISNKFEI